MEPRSNPRARENRALRLAVAIGVALVIVMGAPFIGQVRAATLTRFPAQYRLIIGSAVLASIAVLVLVAVIRIREARAKRYAALGASLAIGLGCELAFRTGNANVDVVEAFHFVEYGVVTLLFYRVWRSNGDASAILFPVLAAIVAGTCDEWFQWFVPERAGEMRDILMNGVAAVCGILFGVALNPPPPTSRPHRLTAIGGSVAFTVLFAGTFFSTVHLGYEIADPDIGVFRSRDTVAELTSEASERADRWRDHPPLVAPRVSREDQYLSEGLWHVRRRNEAVSEKDFPTAWRENLILEKFYSPILTSPSYTGPSGLSWPAAQRADIETKSRGVALSFVSDANPYPIYIWPKAVFWVALVLLSCAIVTACARADRHRT